MQLSRENIRRPFYDFTKATGTIKVGENFEELDLVALIDYMKSYGFKLGLDFSFVMGYDCPGKKYLAAVNGPSYMQWVKEPGNRTSDIRPFNYSKEVQLCISLMKQEKMKSDHLEVWVEEGNEAPFYKGQQVIGSDSVQEGSRIKRGQRYTIRICHYAQCKGEWYWYVGVEGDDNDWMTPRLFEAVNP